MYEWWAEKGVEPMIFNVTIHCFLGHHPGTVADSRRKSFHMQFVINFAAKH